jgi:hypothetical protein
MAVKNKVIRKPRTAPAALRRPGRPRLYDETMTALLPIRMTLAQKTQIEDAARRARATSVNDWGREKLLAAARLVPGGEARRQNGEE